MTERAVNDPDYIAHIAAVSPDFSVDFLEAPALLLFGDSASATKGLLEQEWDSAAANASTTNQASFGEAISSFLDKFFRSNATEPRPQSWDAFITTWRKHAFTGDLATPSTIGPRNATTVGATNPFEGAVEDFIAMGPRDEDLLDSAWRFFVKENPVGTIAKLPEFLNTGVTLPALSAVVSQASLEKAFLDTFAAFSKYAKVETTSLTSAADIQNAFNQWLFRTSNPTTLNPNASFSPGDDVNLQSYERIYQQYLPGTSIEIMQADFVRFANKMYEDEGYFYPTHFIEKWVDHVKAASVYRGQIVFGTEIVSVERLDQARILNEIFDLLVEMIGIIQKATSALANRLQFYAAYQRELTKLMEQVPIFTREDGTALGQVDESNPAQGGAPAQANAVGQAALDTLRAHRDIVGDETKQLQTTVNQLNDAASQQGNIATAILQQLSGILTLIFR